MAEITDKSFIHKQTAPLAQWVILHELEKYPSVSVVDAFKNKIDSEIIYTNINTVTVNLAKAASGYAYLN